MGRDYDPVGLEAALRSITSWVHVFDDSLLSRAVSPSSEKPALVGWVAGGHQNGKLGLGSRYGSERPSGRARFSGTFPKPTFFVADGIFKAELNEFLTRELAEDGYSGVEVRVTPTRTEIIILATRTQNVLGEKGRRIRELTAVVQKRFGFPEGSVELYAEKVATRGLCAIAQAESLRYKLLGGLAVRRACYGVLRFIMESGAKGCEVVVSGKLRGQRAKSMKFVDGLMIHSGDPVNYYVDTAVRHVLLRQGVLGIKVKIMLPWDPSGKIGPKKPLPDHVSIVEPKEEILPTTPISEQKGGKPEQPAMPQPVPTA
nr:PREDICTED: 40S ribosomal protein S3 [Struthio camelus australis]